MEQSVPEWVVAELGLQRAATGEVAFVLPKPREATAVTGFLLEAVRHLLSARQSLDQTAGMLKPIKLIAVTNGVAYAVTVGVDALLDTALADALDLAADVHLEEALKALRRIGAEPNEEGRRILRGIAASCLSVAHGQYRKSVTIRTSGPLDWFRPKAAKIDLHRKAMLSALVGSAVFWEIGAYPTARDLAEEAKQDFADYRLLSLAALENAVRLTKAHRFHARYFHTGGNPELSDTQSKEERAHMLAEIDERIGHLQYAHPRLLATEQRRFDLVHRTLTHPRATGLLDSRISPGEGAG